MISQAQFVKKVVSDITFGDRIPNKINNNRLSQIISDTIDLFRDKDTRSTMQHHVIIKNSNFSTDLFRNHRKVKMPECVKAVTDLVLSNRQYRYMGSTIDTDFNKMGTFASMFTNTGTSLLQAIASTSYYDFANSLALATVSYDFSEFSHELSINGATPRADLIAEVHSYICEEAMYSMPSFFRYVCGRCMQEFSIITSFTKQRLLNDYDLDVAKIEKRGDKLISDVEKEWEAQLGENNFILEF